MATTPLTPRELTLRAKLVDRYGGGFLVGVYGGEGVVGGGMGGGGGGAVPLGLSSSSLSASLSDATEDVMAAEGHHDGAFFDDEDVENVSRAANAPPSSKGARMRSQRDQCSETIKSLEAEILPPAASFENDVRLVAEGGASFRTGRPRLHRCSRSCRRPRPRRRRVRVEGRPRPTRDESATGS